MGLASLGGSSEVSLSWETFSLEGSQAQHLWKERKHPGVERGKVPVGTPSSRCPRRSHGKLWTQMVRGLDFQHTSPTRLQLVTGAGHLGKGA